MYNRAKQFVWRACKEIIPTYYNLKRRKVIEKDLCPFVYSNLKQLFMCYGSVKLPEIFGVKAVDLFRVVLCLLKFL